MYTGFAQASDFEHRWSWLRCEVAPPNVIATLINFKRLRGPPVVGAPNATNEGMGHGSSWGPKHLVQFFSSQTRSATRNYQPYTRTMSQVSSSASSSANSASGDTLYDIDINGVECVVCRESQPLCSFPDKITDTCDHGTIHTCQPCIEQVILQALEGKEWNDPACPECNASLSLNNVQQLGTAAQAETYSNRLMKRALQSMEDYRECLSPICNGGQLHDGGEDYPIVTCHSCQATSCYTHQIPYHFDETCEQFDEKIRESTERENLERSIALVMQLCKTCPGCGFDIEKTTGCDHVSNKQTSPHKICLLTD
jgi:hypothetical protein